MIIRKANQTEINLIKSYAEVVQTEATLGYLGENTPIHDMQIFYQSYYLVVADSYGIKGWILVGEAEDPFTFEQCGILLEIYVLAHYRKNGYGQWLISTALDELKQRGFRKVHLNVFRGNNARKLYEKMGFQDVTTLMEKLL